MNTKRERTHAIHELMSSLRAFRNRSAHGREPVDGEELARQLRELGFSVSGRDLAWVAADLLRGLDHQGRYFVPSVVVEALNTLLDGRQVEAVLDPWAGLGVLAAAIHEEAHSERTVACIASSQELSLAKVLAPQIACELVGESGPLAVIDTIMGEFDTITSILPMGARPRPLEVTLRGGATWRCRDLAQALLAASTAKMSPEGRAYFVVPTSFFFARDSIVPRLRELELGLDAAFELPAGSFAPFTTVDTYLVVLSRNLGTSTFVAQLSAEGHSNRQVLSNFHHGAADGPLEMGRIVDTESFRGLGPLRLDEKLNSLAQRFGTPATPLGELTLALRLGRRKDDFAFPPTDNCVFVPLIGTSDVVTSLSEMSLKLQNYAQLEIDPGRSDAHFVAHFLNSDLGRTVRDGHKSGSTIRKLNTTGLRELQVFIPGLDRQRKILDVAAAISEQYGTVLSFQNELTDLDRELWAHPGQVDRIEKGIKDFSVKMRTDPASHAAATLEQWYESLPFPLASVLRAWQASQARDFRAKQEYLLHFFEATAEFLSTIYLSAFSSRPEFYAPHRTTLSRALGKQKLSITHSSFGAWKVIVEYFSKQTRLLVGGDEQSREFCADIFADPSLELSNMLGSKQLATTLSAANKMRNDWGGHSGVTGQAEATLRSQLLVSELQKLREAMGSVWETVRLVRALGCEPRRGVFENEVSLMMGSNSEFLKETRTLLMWLDVERLHLVSEGSGRALSLLPFVQVGPSPSSSINACYFFNRLDRTKARFVSYHFPDESAIIEEAPGLADMIRDLTDPASSDDRSG